MTTPYRVPFRVDRSDAPPVYRLVNTSPETLTGLRVLLLGTGLMLPVSRLRLRPGAALTVIVRGSNLARSSVLVVRWFRPGGEEYLWRVSF
jgi:hypothetical protein